MPDATGFRENGNAASPLHFAAHHCKTAVRSPTPVPKKPPQAAGPCSWACRRLRPPSPQPNRNAAHPPPARGVGVRRIRANGAGRRHCRPPARGAGVLFSVRHPGARGKEGAVPCDAALPRRGKGRCRCAGSTLFAPAGQKRFRVGAPDLGWFMGKSILWGGLPIRGAFPARRGTESGQPFIQTAFPNRRRRQAPARGLAAVCMHSRPKRNESQPVCPLLVGQTGVNFEPTALAAGTAGPAGSARTRSRVQTLENPFLGTAAVSPSPPFPQRRRRQASARGPAAVYSLHRPNRTETQSARPLLVGRALVNTAPTATGRRHCRPEG